MMEKEKKKGHSLLRILGVTGPYTKFQKLPVTVTLLFATKWATNPGPSKEVPISRCRPRRPGPPGHRDPVLPSPAMTSRRAVIARLRSPSAARRSSTARDGQRIGSGEDGEPRSQGGDEHRGSAIGQGGLRDGLTGCIRTPEPAASAERGRWRPTCRRSGRSQPSPSASKSSPWATPKWGK